MKNEITFSNGSRPIVWFILLCGPLLYPVASLTTFKIFHFSVLFGFVFTAIIFLYYRNRIMIKLLITSKWFSLYIFTLIISYSYSTDKVSGLFDLYSLATCYLMFFNFSLLLMSCNIKSICRFFSSLVIILFIINLFLLYKYGMIRADSDTKESLKSYSNLMMFFSLVSLPYIVFSLKLEYSNTSRVFIRIIIFLCFINVISSESRLGILVLMIYALIYLFLMIRKNYFYLFIVFFFSIVIFCFTERIMTHQVFDRLNNTNTEVIELYEAVVQGGSSENLNRRNMMYHFGVDVIKNNYKIGLGLGSFKRVMENDYRTGLVPHNIFLEVIGSAGILGLFTFMVLSWSVLSGLRKLSQIDSQLSDWYKLNIFMFLLMIFMGQFRPLMLNYIFYFPIAVCYSGMQNFKNKDKFCDKA